MLVVFIGGQFAMSHGSYDLNLGSEILILGGDIRSRSWLNIGDLYSKFWTISNKTGHSDIATDLNCLRLGLVLYPLCTGTITVYNTPSFPSVLSIDLMYHRRWNLSIKLTHLKFSFS